MFTWRHGGHVGGVNKETGAMLEEWNILLGIELYFYVNSSFCFIMVSWANTLYSCSKNKEHCKLIGRIPMNSEPKSNLQFTKLLYPRIMWIMWMFICAFERTSLEELLRCCEFTLSSRTSWRDKKLITFVFLVLKSTWLFLRRGAFLVYSTRKI